MSQIFAGKNFRDLRLKTQRNSQNIFSRFIRKIKNLPNLIKLHFPIHAKRYNLFSSFTTLRPTHRGGLVYIQILALQLLGGIMHNQFRDLSKYKILFNEKLNFKDNKYKNLPNISFLGGF